MYDLYNLYTLVSHNLVELDDEYELEIQTWTQCYNSLLFK